MKTLLVFSNLISLLSSFQTASTTNDGARMTVSGYKWARARQKVDMPEADAGGKGKDLEGFSFSGPSDVISVNTLADNAFKEDVLINRVEFSDGSIWQKKRLEPCRGEGKLRACTSRAMDSRNVQGPLILEHGTG